jgi:metal transporter CNNM
MDLFLTLLTVLILIALSAAYSGLNVSLLSLNLADLKRKAKLGNIYAKKILPLRQRSNLTLASILISNVAVISATSLVLNKQYNGWVAGISSTLLIVIFGEILPQAFFSRNALEVTATFVPLLELMIIITYPIAKPLELLLNKLLGDERQKLPTRRELGFIITEQTDQEDSELDEDEIEIMRGALQLSEKHVRDIMTPIKDVYWITPETDLTPEIIDEIKLNSYSRIPIFDNDCTKSYGFLLMKDLVDINFDNEIVKLDDVRQHPSQIVGGLTALDTLFRKFISSGLHIMSVEKNNKIIGIVTFEDLIEEILQHEIVDETDRY